MTSGNSRASRYAIPGVASVLALSAIVIRNGYGKVSPEVRVQPSHARLQVGLLVVDRHHHVQHRLPGLHAARVRGSRRAGSRVVTVMPATIHAGRVATLCRGCGTAVKVPPAFALHPAYAAALLCTPIRSGQRATAAVAIIGRVPYADELPGRDAAELEWVVFEQAGILTSAAGEPSSSVPGGCADMCAAAGGGRCAGASWRPATGG